MKKICILGKLQTKYEAPFDDKSWEIWAFNEHPDAKRIPRVDKWFNLHEYAADFDVDYTIKNFPFDMCENLVSGQYFNNCLSYLIAFAILQDADQIKLYGCRFDSDDKERSCEFANVRELIFFAKGLGIAISAPADRKMTREWYTYIDWKRYRKEHDNG